MTVEEINNVVTQVTKEFECNLHATRTLQRYFIYKYCRWMTQESIGRMFGIDERNVRASIRKAEIDSSYVFVKLKIHESIKKCLTHG